MADHDDERRLLRWIAENGGPAATVNVTGRGGEIGIANEALPAAVDTLVARDLATVLDDGDLRLTALGRALVESPDG